MDYYCYISHTKVDQLIAEIGEKNPIEVSEEEIKKKDKSASGGLSQLLALFNANLSYGRSDVLQTKATLKVSYSSKLKTVLNKLAPEVVELKTLSNQDMITGGVYLYRNDFVVKEIDSAQLMTSLEAKEAYKSLVLHCSLQFFSESPVVNGVPRFHSSNYAFFEKRLPVTFETVFFLIAQKGAITFGSPLYLKLSARMNLIL
jgi:hypothetical protein